MVKACLRFLVILLVFFMAFTFFAGAARAEDTDAREVRTEAEALRLQMDQIVNPFNMLLAQEQDFIDRVVNSLMIVLRRRNLAMYNDLYFGSRNSFETSKILLKTAYRFLNDGYPGIAREYVDRAADYFRIGQLYNQAAMRAWDNNIAAAEETLKQIRLLKADTHGISGKAISIIPGSAVLAVIIDQNAIALEYRIDAKHKNDEARLEVKKAAYSFLEREYTEAIISGLDMAFEEVRVEKNGLKHLGIGVAGIDEITDQPNAYQIFYSLHEDAFERLDLMTHSLTLAAETLRETAELQPEGEEATGRRVAYVAAGETHALTITEDKNLWTWGVNGTGQLGDGTTNDRYEPVNVLRGVIAADAGSVHSLALLHDGTLWAWGSNRRGQLGDRTNTDRYEPMQMLSRVSAVAAGAWHTLAIQDDLTLWAWGNNEYGQIGDRTNVDKTEPVQVLTDARQIFACKFHSFAIRGDGTLWGWGNNENGQLGAGPAIIRLEAVRILSDVVSISTEENFTVAIQTDGTLLAWGNNEYGQLGDGTTENRNRPVRVLTDVVSVSTGKEHVIALRNDGSLWAWGNNEYGQLGDGTNRTRIRPVEILAGVRSIAAGGWHSMAIRNDGTLWAWGENSLGELGDGSGEDRREPVQILTGVASVYAKTFHTFAVKEDRSLWAWGLNELGQLGDGSTENRYAPVIILQEAPPVQQVVEYEFAEMLGRYLSEIDRESHLELKADGSFALYFDAGLVFMGYPLGFRIDISGAFSFEDGRVILSMPGDKSMELIIDGDELHDKFGNVWEK